MLEIRADFSRTLLVIAIYISLPTLSSVLANECVDSPSVEDSAIIPDFGRTNFAYGIALVGLKHENNSQCGQELEEMLIAFKNKENWAIRVFEAFGTQPQGFVWGNFFWFPPQDLCDELNEPYKISLTYKQTWHNNVTSPFRLRFSVVYLDFFTPYYTDLKLAVEHYMHIGLCLPDSCSSEDVYQYTLEYFDKNEFETQRNYEIELKEMEPKIKTPHFTWDVFKTKGFIIFFSILFCILTLNLLAEIKRRSILAQNETSLEKSFFDQLLECFCLHTNYMKVMNLQPKKSGNYVTCIDGLKTFVCLWITIFHVYYYCLFTVPNSTKFFSKLDKFLYQPISQALFYVDMFFSMGAFLMAQNFLTNHKQIQEIRTNPLGKNIKLILRSVFKRWMRLTPVMIVTMIISDMVMEFINVYTPFDLGKHSGVYCKVTWWHNLLFIQNLLDMKNICCSWSWYLACEMQFFILVTILLHIYVKNPQLAKKIYMIFTPTCVVVSFLCYNYYKINFHLDLVQSKLGELYVKPWVRIVPYLGGATMGWVMAMYQNETETKTSSTAVSQKENKTESIDSDSIAESATSNNNNNNANMSSNLSLGHMAANNHIGGMKLKSVNNIFNSFETSQNASNLQMRGSKSFSQISPAIHSHSHSLSQSQLATPHTKITTTTPGTTISATNLNSGLRGNRGNSFECQINETSCSANSGGGQHKTETISIDHIKSNNNNNKSNERINVTTTSTSTSLTMKQRIEGKASWVSFYWFFCLCLYFYTSYMSFWRSTPSWIVCTIMSLGKLIFSYCVGGLIFLCSVGFGPGLNGFLSAPVFIFFNKFAYSLYMIAPPIIFAIFGLRSLPTAFDEVTSGCDFITSILVSLAAGFLLVIMVEMPMQRVGDLILQKRKTKLR